jgi:hypothetical protein
MPKTSDGAERKHKATYATDKRNGGYLVRISGPYPEMFAGREVPVTMKSGEEHSEKLVRLIWTGVDKESGDRVSLYKFESKPRVEEAAPEF